MMHSPPLPHLRAMVFVDGTNLFYRLQGARLILQRGALAAMCRQFGTSHNTMFWRAYVYTSEHHFERAQRTHQEDFARDVRIVFGDAIPTGDGNVKEKGVDALLVADLIYHAAARNITEPCW